MAQAMSAPSSALDNCETAQRCEGESSFFKSCKVVAKGGIGGDSQSGPEWTLVSLRKGIGPGHRGNFGPVGKCLGSTAIGGPLVVSTWSSAG